MFSVVNSRPMWPSIGGAPGQLMYSALPGTPFVFSPAAFQPPTLYYQLQPAWFTAAPQVPQCRSRQPSDDDVFYPDTSLVYDNSFILVPSVPFGDNEVSAKASLSMKAPLYPIVESVAFENQVGNSLNGSHVFGILESSHVKRKRYETPTKFCYFSDNSPDESSDSNDTSSSLNKKDDSMIHPLLSASLCAALNDDPPEPKCPQKTSSPIQEETKILVDQNKMRKRRGRYITNGTEKCPRFSDNGVTEDLDQCDIIRMQNFSKTLAEEQMKKREDFLKLLEVERERQRKVVLPKHAPKMSCKFCKNNGESPEVYTKHRLRYSEKTVCPLLRHYVCRKCNSTGDFAHTIRHCPFNNKQDTIAWQATFLD